MKGSIPYKKHPPGIYHEVKFAKPGELYAVPYPIPGFEKLTGITYLSHLEFESAAVLYRVRQQCIKGLRFGTIDHKMKWLGALYAKQIESGYVKDLVIRWIDKTIGYGAFANGMIAKGDYIGEYTGVVKKCNLFYSNVNEYCFHYPIYNLFINVHTIDAENKGNEMRYLNHSNAPNCESVIVYHGGLLHVCIRAKTDITLGDELTYNYGKDWWGDRKTLVER